MPTKRYFLPTGARAAASLCLLGSALAGTARAQEASRPSMTRQRAAQSIPTDYNVKVGPVNFRFNAALRSEYVDNVNLSSGRTTPLESDLIFNPQLGIAASWPITNLNTLRLQTTLGYTKYLAHPELDSSSVIVAPDSQLSLDLYSGDFRLNLHEQFSYQQDPLGDGTLSNVSRFGRFTNTVGATLLWDLRDLVLTLGYDHTNLITTGSTGGGGATTVNTSALDRTTDQISTSAFLNFTSAFTAGIEGTASSTRYPGAPLNDSTGYSVGPFLSAQLTRYTKLYLAGGFQSYTSGNGSAQNDPTTLPGNAFSGLQNQRLSVSAPAPQRSGSSHSYYANLTIAHRLNRFYSDRLSAGHESTVGLFSQRTETNFVNYSSAWQLNAYFSLSTALYFEDINETGVSAAPPFTRFGAAFSTSYQFTKKLSGSLLYQFTNKTSTSLDQSYRQNRIALTLSYQF